MQTSQGRDQNAAADTTENTVDSSTSTAAPTAPATAFSAQRTPLIAEYVSVALVGALGLVFLKLLMTKLPPKFAAMIGVVPIGILSSYYIYDRQSKIKFVKDYIKCLCILLVSASILVYMLDHTTMPSSVCVAIWICIWFVCVATYVHTKTT